MSADWLEYFIPQCGQSPQIAAWLDCWWDIICDVEAPPPKPGTVDMPASSNKACDCSWLYVFSVSPSWCSERSTSGSYSTSDFGDCLSGFTCTSSDVFFIGLLDELLCETVSVFESFDLLGPISPILTGFFPDKLLALSLFEGLIPENTIQYSFYTK